MLERDVIKKVQRFAASKGVASIRMVFRHGVASGWPDYLYLIPGGRPLFIEYKATGGKTTPLQDQKIALLKARGYDVETCDSPDAAIAAISKALEAARLSEQGS